jgi:hypothetical protein
MKNIIRVPVEFSPNVTVLSLKDVYSLSGEFLLAADVISVSTKESVYRLLNRGICTLTL